MNKIKTYINSYFTIKNSTNDFWVHSSIDNCDLIISIDEIKSFKKNVTKILWLYEPKSIIPETYKIVENCSIEYEIIACHLEDFHSINKSIKIEPYLPSWIDESDRIIYNKTKNLSMIASTKIMCKEHEYRQEVASQVHQKCDLYGFGREKEIKAKVDGLRDYRFSIAMENCCADTYFTEKILDCFLTGTVPIYWGTRKICNIFNENGIVFLDYFLENIDSFDYEKEYKNRYKAIEENFEIAKEKNYSEAQGINSIIKNIIK